MASLAGYEVEVLVDRHQHCSYDQALAIADCLLSSRSQSQSRWVKSARALPFGERCVAPKSLCVT